MVSLERSSKPEVDLRSSPHGVPFKEATSGIYPRHSFIQGAAPKAVLNIVHWIIIKIRITSLKNIYSEAMCRFLPAHQLYISLPFLVPLFNDDISVYPLFGYFLRDLRLPMNIVPPLCYTTLKQHLLWDNTVLKCLLIKLSLYYSIRENIRNVASDVHRKKIQLCWSELFIMKIPVRSAKILEYF